MKKQKISKLFEDCGFNYKDMEENRFYPVSGWEILSLNENKEKVWKNITHLVRKTSCTPILVVCNGDKDDVLLVSPEHQFYVKVFDVESWVEAIDLIDQDDILVYHEDKGWVQAFLCAGNEETDILDLTVNGTESYFSNGILSHNTMHGDPTVVPGGELLAPLAGT